MVAVVLSVAAGALQALLPRLALPPQRLARLPLDDLVVTASAAVGCVLVIGLGCCLAAALLEALVATVGAARPAAAWRCPATPQWARRLVFAACGLGLLAVAGPGTATAASAGSPGVPTAVATSGGSWPAERVAGGDDACPRRCAGELDGLPLPDLPVVDPPSPAHRVRPGESLWSIAASQLPRDATNTHVARRVNRLYAANRAVIGDDRDLIFPGTLLAAPEATS